MKRELLSIYGPLSINSYGVAIVIGILLFLFLIRLHPKAVKLNLYMHITDILLISILAGIIGGRLLYIISEPEAEASLFGFLSFWDGGFSILGSILAIIPTLAYYLNRLQIPVLPCLDLLALHAPLLQSISRLGCFFAGCCYGCPVNNTWGLIYTDPQSMAPLHVSLHPTQLYSAITLLVIFLFLYCIAQKIFTKPGQLLSVYLLLVGMERFSIDFWRADRIFYKIPSWLPFAADNLSVNQLISLCIIVVATALFLYLSFKKNTINLENQINKNNHVCTKK
ncbi:MAG: prolipoprotein diacylglyceryl transferase [Candidatus Dependentiae bacterium]|nr:prolipoprotein diacylglyceryl transferase [Candidatus Dependentiae bacterium]